MECLKDRITYIDIFVNGSMTHQDFNSDGMTGKEILALFNIKRRDEYTIVCSKCRAVLKGKG